MFLAMMVLAVNSAMGLIATDASVSKDGSGASTTITTPAFSTSQANELLLAFVATDYISGTNTTVTSLSGGGLTWTLVQRTNGQSGSAEIWRALAPAPLSNVTITASLSQNVISSMTVMSFTGVNTSGTNGSGAIGAVAGKSAASGAPTASLVSTANNSWVVGVGNDYDNATSRTVGTGQTLLHQYLTPTGDTYWVQMQTNPVALAGTTVAINDTKPTNDRFNLSICEIVPAAAAGSTWSISGTISPVAGGSGATVALSGAATASTVADANGNYRFSGVTNGSYTVTPSQAGFTFTPVNKAVTVTGADQTGVNFAGVANTWAISGTISPAASASGVTVALSGAATASTVTDANGNYSFANLSSGSYVVTPTKTGFTFSPSSQSVTVSGANVSATNFTAQVMATGGITLIQDSVNGNESSASAISTSFTAANTAGNFLIVSGTIARPAGTLSISDTAGNSYIPVTTPVTDANQDTTSYLWYVPVCKGGVNSVTLTPASAGALEIHVSEWSGVSATYPVDAFASAAGTGANASSGPVTTTANGELVYGYTFLLNTATAGSGFAGMTLVNGDLDEYQIQSSAGSIAATYSQQSGTWFARVATFRPSTATMGIISGSITPATGGGGATVTLSGTENATVQADANGNYSFAGLPNGSYSVTPSKIGFSFTPVSQTVSLSGTNQTASQLRGTDDKLYLEHLWKHQPCNQRRRRDLTLSGSSSGAVIADANGNYSFSGLTNGSYT